MTEKINTLEGERSVNKTPTKIGEAAAVTPPKEADRGKVIYEKLSDDDRRPCNWDLAMEEGRVVGTNLITGRKFEGTLSEFNIRILRGG